MNLRIASRHFALIGATVFTLACFKAFTVTGAPGWALMSIIIAGCTSLGLARGLFKDEVVALIFGLTGGAFTCLFVYAFNLTFARPWCITA